jgi:trehalose synthase
MRALEDYRSIIGDEIFYSIYKKASKLYGKSIVHINSTYLGGGVAEILNSLVPLMNNIGIDTEWRILHGNTDFFSITKKFHNSLQGEDINLSDLKMNLYLETNESFSIFTHLDHDIVVVHDPQPLPMIKYYKKKQPWVWRCHIDFSNPELELVNFLKQFMLMHDKIIFSHEKYKHDSLPVDYKIMPPAIDPLTVKNRELDKGSVAKYLKKYNIPTDKPIITQISRFDKWKDPSGVIEVFKKVKEKVDCRLILCGSMAVDDPEGWQVHEDVQSRAKDLVKSGDVILITVEDTILVNVLQSSSAVVIQKSTKEGFGLTVTEALWKGRPVVGSNVGGIPLQIIDGETGFLVDPYDIDGCAKRVLEFLKKPKLAEKMGQNGKEFVRKNYLITRLLSDYLDMFIETLEC